MNHHTTATPSHLDETVLFQDRVRLEDGMTVDGEGRRQLPGRREPVAGAERAFSNPGGNTLSDLEIDRSVRTHVESDQHLTNGTTIVIEQS